MKELRAVLGCLFCILMVAACTETNNRNVTQVTQVNVVQANTSLVAKPAPKGAILPCSLEPKLSSIVGDQLPVRYDNETNASISIYWLDAQGARKSYGTVESGKTFVRPGSPTSYWLVADNKDRCIEIVQPGITTATVVVKDTEAGTVAGPK